MDYTAMSMEPIPLSKVKIIANKDGKLSLSMKALEDVAAEQIEEETFDLPKSEDLGTSLGSLFAKLKL